MLLPIFILIALGAFFVGYSLGTTCRTKFEPRKKKRIKSDPLLAEEYQNFLNYDGREQL